MDHSNTSEPPSWEPLVGILGILFSIWVVCQVLCEPIGGPRPARSQKLAQLSPEDVTAKDRREKSGA